VCVCACMRAHTCLCACMRACMGNGVWETEMHHQSKFCPNQSMHCGDSDFTIAQYDYNWHNAFEVVNAVTITSKMTIVAVSQAC